MYKHFHFKLHHDVSSHDFLLSVEKGQYIAKVNTLQRSIHCKGQYIAKVNTLQRSIHCKGKTLQRSIHCKGQYIAKVNALQRSIHCKGMIEVRYRGRFSGWPLKIMRPHPRTLDSNPNKTKITIFKKFQKIETAPPFLSQNSPKIKKNMQKIPFFRKL